MNLTGMTEFRTKPQKVLYVYQILFLLEGKVWKHDRYFCMVHNFAIFVDRPTPQKKFSLVACWVMD